MEGTSGTTDVLNGGAPSPGGSVAAPTRGTSRGIGEPVDAASGAARSAPRPAGGASAIRQTELVPSRLAERRQLTIMMCDLVDSTALAAQLDPEDLREVIGACLDCIKGVVTRHGGVVSRFLGDGALAYFGYPKAHEDDVERAIRAGLQVVAAIRQLALSGRHKPRIRVGIATGLVVVGDPAHTGPGAPDQDVVGATPNLAARLQAIAGPDEVVIASSTHKLASGLFAFRNLGPVMLKGFSEPVTAWLVLGPRKVENPFDARHETGMSPLVGRREELALLLRRWEQAQSGTGRGVLISGEPGIGKSRIRRALQECLADQPHLAMSFYCSPQHRDSSFFPVISRYEHWAGFTDQDSPEEKLGKFEAFIGRTIRDAEQIALIGELLSLPVGERQDLRELGPEEHKEKTMEALLAPLAVLSARRPLLILFEDLHWIDPSTLELLELMLERLARLRVLLVVTARQDFIAPWPNHAHMTTITLSRLNRDEAAELAQSAAGGKPLPVALLGPILARAEGVPLFIEELTKTVLESGVVLERDGTYVLEGPPPSAAIPVTLHDSLMARLDRTGGLREIAQVGAAIGREFSPEVLREVSGAPAAKIDAALAQLVHAQLLTRRGEAPDSPYAFKHALIRDAAYGTLLRARRQHLHARIVTVLEERFPRLAEQQPELLGHHCSEAGLVEKAVGYWGKAGRKSAARHAKIEAVVHFRRALALLATLPPTLDGRRQELELESALGRALIAARINAEETGESYRRARELCEELGDTATLARVLGGLAMYHLGRCELALTRRAAEDLLRLGEKQNDTAACLAGHLFRGLCLYWVGELALAKDELERVLDFAIPEAEQSSAAIAAWDMRIAAQCFLSLTLLVLGQADQALRHSQEAIARSRGLRPPQILVRELTYAGLFNLLRRAESDALVLVDEAISLATEKRYPFWLDIACIIRGSALAARGDTAEGLRLAREAAAEREKTGSVGGQTYFLGLLAQLYDTTNQPDEAWDLLRAALDLAERTGERWFEPELHRMHGEWLLSHRQHAEAEAESWLRQAYDLACRRGAKLWQLRAALGLGRLWLGQGKGDDARALLTPVYQTFTEGFGTPDLADAKALLDRLTGLEVRKTAGKQVLRAG